MQGHQSNSHFISGLRISNWPDCSMCVSDGGAGRSGGRPYRRSRRGNTDGEIASRSAKCTEIFFPKKLFQKTVRLSSSCVSPRDFYFQDSLFFLTRFLCMLSCSIMSNLCNPMDCSPPGSSVCGISQARILEWVAIPFSRGSSPPRDRTYVSRFSCVSSFGRQILYHQATWEAPNTPWSLQCNTKVKEGTPIGTGHLRCVYVTLQEPGTIGLSLRNVTPH